MTKAAESKTKPEPEEDNEDESLARTSADERKEMQTGAQLAKQAVETHSQRLDLEDSNPTPLTVVARNLGRQRKEAFDLMLTEQNLLRELEEYQEEIGRLIKRQKGRVDEYADAVQVFDGMLVEVGNKNRRLTSGTQQTPKSIEHKPSEDKEEEEDKD